MTHRLARVTTGAAYILLFAGAMVTSTGSGLAVPDWPLAFGKFFPVMEGGVFFEHGHRMIAGIVALLTFALAAVVLRTETRPAVRLAAKLAAGLIVAQALLGGATVLLKLPKPVSISHACLGQAVFCLLLAVTQWTHPGFSRTDAAPFALGAAAVAAVYLQLIFGALYRHTGLGLAFHILWAFGAAGVALAAAYRGILSSAPELRGPSWTLALLVPSQVALGFAALVLKKSHAIQAPATTALHLALGAAILGTAVVWTMRTKRGPTPSV